MITALRALALAAISPYLLVLRLSDACRRLSPHNRYLHH